MLWSALLHDVDKVQKFINSDKTHPFKSAAMTLVLFKKIGFITEDVTEACDAIRLACKPITEKKYWKYMMKKHGTIENVAPEEHDHSQLPLIFEKVYKLFPQNSF